MKNIFFDDETISENDLYFICSIIERIAREIHQPNYYVVNKIGKEKWVEKLSLAQALHSENPLQVVNDFINEFHLQQGNFDITNVDKSLVDNIPTVLQMGKVYARLIIATMQENENFADGIVRVYNSEICQIIDNYNSSAYYEPSNIIKQAYYNNSFN